MKIRRAYCWYSSSNGVIGQIPLARISRIYVRETWDEMYSSQSCHEYAHGAHDQHSWMHMGCNRALARRKRHRKELQDVHIWHMHLLAY